MSGTAVENTLLRGVIAFLPTPILAWLNRWLDVLGQAGLAHPHWRRAADNQTLAIGILVALAICIALRDQPNHVLKRITVTSVIFSILTFSVCAFARHKTAGAAVIPDIEDWKAYWHVIYVVMAVVWLGTITTLALYFLRPDAPTVRKHDGR